MDIEYEDKQYEDKQDNRQRKPIYIGVATFGFKSNDNNSIQSIGKNIITPELFKYLDKYNICLNLRNIINRDYFEIITLKPDFMEINDEHYYRVRYYMFFHVLERDNPKDVQEQILKELFINNFYKHSFVELSKLNFRSGISILDYAYNQLGDPDKYLEVAYYNLTDKYLSGISPSPPYIEREIDLINEDCLSQITGEQIPQDNIVQIYLEQKQLEFKNPYCYDRTELKTYFEAQSRKKIPMVIWYDDMRPVHPEFPEYIIPYRAPTPRMIYSLPLSQNWIEADDAHKIVYTKATTFYTFEILREVIGSTFGMSNIHDKVEDIYVLSPGNNKYYNIIINGSKIRSTPDEDIPLRKPLRIENNRLDEKGLEEKIPPVEYNDSDFLTNEEKTHNLELEKCRNLIKQERHRRRERIRDGEIVDRIDPDAEDLDEDNMQMNFNGKRKSRKVKKSKRKSRKVKKSKSRKLKKSKSKSRKLKKSKRKSIKVKESF